ncbi:hypothetical protein [Streptomyces sp. NPDC006739]|uniref:hypothetical protein n=1 Tax=Streptomyces sp. NPDC006739 TaxID=3364763 RepID=UPI0036C1A44D
MATDLVRTDRRGVPHPHQCHGALRQPGQAKGLVHMQAGAIELAALRALRKSRTDLEALDLTADRLRRLQDAFTKAADDSRTRADRYAEEDDADAAQPVPQDDLRAHRPQEVGPHRSRECAISTGAMPCLYPVRTRPAALALIEGVGGPVRPSREEQRGGRKTAGFAAQRL